MTARRVLVADDDADIRDLVAFKLRGAGLEVDAFADGASALEHVRAGLPVVPDLVVLDVTMPGLSGVDVCRALRAAPETAEVPVVLLTAKVRESDVATGFSAGADDYVPKPFSPKELLHRVRAVLDRVEAATS